MNTNDFYKLPKDLARADGFISKETGAPVKLTSSAKIVYSYMLNRNDFFTSTLGNQHYESQSTIAEACGLEYKACGNILRTLGDNGVLDCKKLRPNGEGQWRWFYYKVHTDVMLWIGDVKNYEIIESKPMESKVDKKPKPVYIQPKPQEKDWDELDLPF